MSKILGIYTREVWDYRLSIATPTIYNSGKTWVVAIFSKNLPDHVAPFRECDYDENEQPIPGSERTNPGTPPAEPLEVHDTGIPTEHGDANDCAKVKVCYEWLLTVRDKYAMPNIEELKPWAAECRAEDQAWADMVEGLTPAQARLEHAKLGVWAEELAKQGESDDG